MKICIDPGHAGRNTDPGAVNPSTGLEEADMTLMVARLVKQYLEAAGCEVLLTRTEWEQPETDDLDYRTSLSNNWGADVFVSLHCNSADNRDARGYEIWTSPGVTAGDTLANCIYKQISGTFPDMANRGEKEARFYVLTHTDAPACLVEMAFISNDTEAQLLSTPYWQDRMAGAIARGITDYGKE